MALDTTNPVYVLIALTEVTPQTYFVGNALLHA